jgi:ankyrin repeat protein
MNGNIDAVISLLQNGADPTVSHNAAIRLASQKGQANIVSLLLQDGRVDPTDWKNFAIYVASYNGHVDVVDVLLQDGRVDPTDENEEAIRAALTKKIREMLVD